MNIPIQFRMKNLGSFLKVFILAFLVISLIACDKPGNNEDEKEVYTIVYENTDLEDQEVEEGDKLSKPANPTKAGFVFDNWYSDNSFSTVFDFDSGIEEDITIYALFYLTLGKAIEIASELEHNQTTSEKYYIKGNILSIDNTIYGNMTIADDADELYIYGVFSSDGTKKYEELETKPVVGDTVYIYGALKRFNENLEVNNSWLVKMEKNEIPSVDIEDYEDATILEARNSEVGDLLVVEGVVSSITYSHGMTANGIFLVDDTAAIFIYAPDIASSVSVGDTIKVAGERTNYILDTELGFAETHGYEGAIQLAEVRLVSRTEGNDSFSTDWIEEVTIKELLETNPREKNITGNIYKVNTFIRKAPGTGFTNYYFDDLDQNTGSYTYSMNNGSDFSWLDEFDGDLRTVYLAVINAKSSQGGINYRFVPIKISEEYTYDLDDTPAFVVNYYGVDQFETTFTHSPDLELLQTISSEVLGFEDAKLTYTSSNTDSVYFEVVDGKYIFKTGTPGIAEVTITGTYNELTYSRTITITIDIADDLDTITVAEAIALEDDSEVIIEGIVGASLVNQTGYYLIDETGIIAVRTTSEELAKVSLGNLVIISGVKTHQSKFNNDGEMTAIGQVHIQGATVVINKQGNHEYSNSSFIEDKTFEELVGLDLMEDHSSQVYIVEVYIDYVESQFYTRYDLTNGKSGDEKVFLNIYSSNGSQLSFLNQFANQTVTIEFALVNWNGTKYAGSVLAVITEDGRVVNNSNFKN